MPRFFNLAGPNNPKRHYTLPPEDRFYLRSGRRRDLDGFIERMEYFVIHAPRQMGKTTALNYFADRLREEGYAAVVASLEESQGYPTVEEAEPKWLAAIARSAKTQLPAEQIPPPIASVLLLEGATRLHTWLNEWSDACPARIVLLLDEADVVTGPAMISLLRQLRAGFPSREKGHFPSSIALVGMRDLRDYLVEAKDGKTVNPGSPFNIKSASLTMAGFTLEEVGSLLGQHTAETGQVFEPEAIAKLSELTGGQPYLVNAIASLITDDLVPDRTQPVSAAVVEEAAKELILLRTTHLDNLGQRLQEPRVARIVQAVLLGDMTFGTSFRNDDFEYVLDLGLIRRSDQVAEPANPMYREILARELSLRAQDAVPTPWWPWKTPEGRLDFPALVEAFLLWWREHEEMLKRSEDALYHEATAHITFMGFLQRVVNGGGKVHREYAASRGRIDLLVEYGLDRFIIELKRVYPRGDSFEKVLSEGKAQLEGYCASLSQSEGWLIIFDQRPGRGWEERLWRETLEISGRKLHLFGA